ncbi:MAG: alpha/beta fold hydrolase [Candidatus Eremiobacteraeota bacterium]|nr:alpha/beta fold hydrolase [Candidatus Eremiobacteraeota bacterium]
MRVVCQDGAVTGARHCGDGDRTLVFVHGVGSTAAIWDEQLREFGDEYRCFAVELRGNGTFEDPDPSSITRAGFADDVLAVTAAANVDRFTLIGCSLGGVVAFELFGRVPQRFEAMVLAGTFAVYPNAQAYLEGVLAALHEAGSMPAFAQMRAAKLGLPPERTRETVEQMACKSVACYEASSRATWTGDYRALLPEIRVPALVVCGERDTVAPYKLSQEIAMSIPGARLEVIEAAGHVCNADAPDAFDDVVGAFLSSC